MCLLSSTSFTYLVHFKSHYLRDWSRFVCVWVLWQNFCLRSILLVGLKHIFWHMWPCITCEQNYISPIMYMFFFLYSVIITVTDNITSCVYATEVYEMWLERSKNGHSGVLLSRPSLNLLVHIVTCSFSCVWVLVCSCVHLLCASVLN